MARGQESRGNVPGREPVDARRRCPRPIRCPASTTCCSRFRAAEEAVAALVSIPPETIARFLEDYAARIEARADALVELASLETALPQTPRLRNVELPRTTNQLRQGAAAARERLVGARDHRHARPNIRSVYGPLGGPVVVFGPNNFPVRVQLGRGRRLRRGVGRGQSGDRQGQHRPPRDDQAARGVRAGGGCAQPACRRAWCR